MASPVQYSRRPQSVIYPSVQPAGLKQVTGPSPMTALSIEFVAKPEEAHRVETAIPAAIARALEDVAGFAGCLVMISDQEARLVSVVTLWSGHERVKWRNQNVRWVNALLAPYLDRRLRVQTMVAHLPVLTRTLGETDKGSENIATQACVTEEETVCVA